MSKILDKFKLKRKLIAILAGWHFFGNPSARLKIIGVTGTNGKTTTATLLYKIATELGYKTGLIGTVDNIIVKEKREALRTTPSPINLNKLLNEMADKGCEYVFMEVSSHALDQNRVAGIKFAGGIFTNLTHDHLDYHKDFENYFKAKKKFFEMLPEDAFALSNVDDDHGDAMLDGIKADKFFYGFGEETESVDFYGKILKLDFSGLELDFNGEKINSKLLGKFNAYNLLAIWSACKLLNFNMKKVGDILKNIEPPRGRFEHFMSPNGVLIIIDYAHTPDALEKILLTIKEVKSKDGRIISVFGCGGDRDPLKRSKMGKIGASLSDISIFTSMKDDLSHDESKKVITISDRRLAIEEAVELAKKDDIILCAGKGHEEYQEIKNKKHHFNDIEEFKKLFQRK